MKINVKHYHIEVEVNLPDDADMSDIIDSIKGILSICGWSDETWRDQIIELSEHYRKDEQKKLITEIMNDDAEDRLYISSTKSNADMNIGFTDQWKDTTPNIGGQTKQTAVEWLIHQLVTENEVTLKGENYKLFELAKQMEKEQIIEAYYYDPNSDLIKDDGEQYYNETYEQ